MAFRVDATRRLDLRLDATLLAARWIALVPFAGHAPPPPPPRD